MHFKFTSDNGLETIAKKPSNLYLTLGENNMNNIEIRELAINLKLTTGQRETSKDMWPQWVGVWASNTVMWLWSVDTLFWQLSTDHNKDVYHQVEQKLQALTLVRKFHISHWFPYGADRWKKGHVITKISRISRVQNFLGITLLSHALCERVELR